MGGCARCLHTRPASPRCLHNGEFNDDRKSIGGVGAAETKAQVPGLNRQTSDYLTPAPARHGTSCLLVLGVRVLTYARCLACNDCVRGLPFQTKLALSQFPIKTCHVLPTNKPCFVRHFVWGGRYFVYGQNYSFPANSSIKERVSRCEITHGVSHIGEVWGAMFQINIL